MPSAAAPTCVVSEAPSTLPGEANTTVAVALSEGIPRACTEFLFRGVPRNATATMTKTIAHPPMTHLLRAVIAFSPLVLLGHRIEWLCDLRIPAIADRVSRQQLSAHRHPLDFAESDRCSFRPGHPEMQSAHPLEEWEDFQLRPAQWQLAAFPRD